MLMLHAVKLEYSFYLIAFFYYIITAITSGCI